MSDQYAEERGPTLDEYAEIDNAHVRLSPKEQLLMDCEMHLTEIVLILSGKQHERNPTGIILNKSRQLLHRLQNS